MSVDSSSTRGLTASRVLHSRLARCITLSVMLAVALPLGVLAALGGQVLKSLDQRFASRERLVQVRTVAQQVGIRLGNARALLAAWPAEPPTVEPGVTPLDPDLRMRLPGLGQQFRQAALLGADGRLRWSTDGWPGPLAEAATALPRPGVARSQLLTQERNGQPQLVLAQAPRADGSRWLAELSPEALWESVGAGNPTTYWCIQNAQGLRLHCPAPAIASEGSDAPGLVGMAIADRVHVGWTLPLEVDFGAGEWQFDMVQARGPAMVLGPAMTGPLVGGALCALFGVLLTSGVLIRRTLGPLQSLQHGIRQLEHRAPGVRVDIASSDEFGALAQAFNQMAGAVDTQFQSLELLASIDRDIVAHRAVDEVFRRVLVQALPGLGATVMGLARVESARVPRLHLQWNDQTFAHKVRRSVRAMTPQEAQALLGVTVDSVWQPCEGSLSAAWCAPMRQDKDTALQALPLRWQGRTHGLLLIGWAAEPPLQRLREAAELRDRLSVALAAHQRELELTWQARHDDLTGLLNRNGLHQELDTLLTPGVTPGATPLAEEMPARVALAVLFIDLDHFKTVNDNLGHGLGDELLRQAAERLEACAPTRAVVARPGGDEFVLVLPEADDVAAIEVARAVCRRMAVPFSLGGKEHFLGASIGIALAPVHGDNRTDLLRHADMAMYTAKDAGRGRHAMFEEPLDAQLLERSALLADLRQAVVRKELVLHYQPRVCVADGSIVSAEALIRWCHPTRGLVAPGVFIPLAEESELIEAIGLWVIRAACAQLARWRREGVPLQRLSVNVSPRQLQSGRLMEEVEAALVQHGVPWNMLELEVTESLLVGDARSASEQLCRLRERGVLIALDDFGTGYSSMATLRNLPIDVMKVDRAFVQDLSDDPSALAVTRAILTLAQSLGKHTVAEGIETQAQADILRQLGCDEFQGFLFSKAVPATEFAALCRFSALQPVADTAV